MTLLVAMGIKPPQPIFSHLNLYLPTDRELFLKNYQVHSSHRFLSTNSSKQMEANEFLLLKFSNYHL